MNKAYDRVSWLFILKILKAYALPVYLLGLINQCLSNSFLQSSHQWKGHQCFCSHFWPPLGRPIVPLPISLMHRYFSRMTMLAANIRLFQGIQTWKQAPTLTHLFFANDALFFFKAFEVNCTATTSLVNRLCNFLVSSSTYKSLLSHLVRTSHPSSNNTIRLCFVWHITTT